MPIRPAAAAVATAAAACCYCRVRDTLGAAVVGGAGYELYEHHEKKKEREQQQAREEQERALREERREVGRGDEGGGHGCKCLPLNPPPNTHGIATAALPFDSLPQPVRLLHGAVGDWADHQRCRCQRWKWWHEA